MKVLSLVEDEAIAQEADELCAVAEACKTQLHELKRGSRSALSGKVFSCISADKNFIYKVQGKHRWYLKYSLHEKWVRHEMAGAEAVNATLGDFPGYQHPRAVRASLSSRYTLYSAVEGVNFNRAFLGACLSGLTGKRSTAISSMENLGRCIGRLHAYRDRDGLEVLSPDTLSYLRNYLECIKEPDQLEEDIADWVNRQEEGCAPTAWIHGNLKSEDIFINGEKACFIDFGTCGAGAPYEDLTNLCTYMMLLQAVPLFPWRSARRAMSAFLHGYAVESALSKDCLYGYITRGICRYYIKNTVLDDGFASLSGMPIRKSRLKRLIRQLLQGDYEAAFAGVRF